MGQERRCIALEVVGHYADAAAARKAATQGRPRKGEKPSQTFDQVSDPNDLRATAQG